MTGRNRAGGAASKRQLRVGEALRHALAEILMRGDLHDPDVAGVSITVTEVRASPDLRNATAYVKPLGGGNEAAVIAGLNRCAPWLRGQLARQVHLKYAPAICFEIDRSFEHADRLRELLRRPDVAADLTPDMTAEPNAEPEADKPAPGAAGDGSDRHGT